MSDRFVVSSVIGYWIDVVRPPSSTHGTKTPVPISYYVLDRLDGYAVVADFTATPRGRPRGNELRRELAEHACARWNAWADEHGIAA